MWQATQNKTTEKKNASKHEKEANKQTNHLLRVEYQNILKKNTKENKCN
jgi:hypothetical protein